MEFSISESSQKKLDEMICGFLRNEESKKEFIKEKSKYHLDKYHFKTFDEIVEYIKDGYRLFFNNCYEGNSNECIIYNPDTEKVELWKNERSVVEWENSSLTIDEFREKYFFSWLEDGSGYIHKFHKNI